MKFFILCLTFIFCTLSARAQTVIVDRAACRDFVVEHTPADDVATTPAEDGVPATLGGTKVFVPDEFVVNIRAFLDAPIIPLATGVSDETRVINIKYNTKTRQVLLNDKVFVSVDQTQLADLCAKNFKPEDYKNNRPIVNKSNTIVEHTDTIIKKENSIINKIGE